MLKTLQDYRDSFSDLLKENLIFIPRNLMKPCMNKVKKKFLNLFISSCIGKEHTLKTKLKEFVIHSKDRDTSFQLFKKFQFK
jgi:hypothetical protein